MVYALKIVILLFFCSIVLRLHLRTKKVTPKVPISFLTKKQRGAGTEHSTSYVDVSTLIIQTELKRSSFKTLLSL